MGPLAVQGEQTGMVLDFGFLKNDMMSVIHEPCDHGIILWAQDPLTHSMLHAGDHWPQEDHDKSWLKLYVLDDVPTAENLARHWFKLLDCVIRGRFESESASFKHVQPQLVRIDVWETPNCVASYTGEV